MEPFGARPEGLVGHAPQAQPDRRRASLRARPRRPRGRPSVALENVALWHERDISHSSAERVVLPGRVPRARLHARPLRLARRRARRRCGADAPKPRRLARSRLQPARAARARRRRARRETTPIASFRRTRCAPGRRSCDFRAALESDPEIADHLGPEAVRGRVRPRAALRHVDVLFERLAALTGERRARHV